jgi:hypothetical protein
MPKTLSCLLLASLTSIGCHSADSGLNAFIPADTVALAGIRMDQLRAAPLYQKLRAEKRFSELDALQKRTGFDPTTDVREMLIATNGKEAVTVARGSFHPRDVSAQKSAYKGYALYVHGEGAYALIDAATAVAGSKAAVQAAIDQYKNGSPAAKAMALWERGRALPPPNQLWAVSDSPESLLALTQPGNMANVGKIFGQIDRLALGAELGAGLKVVAAGDCRTDQDAKTLGDALRGLVSLGKLSVPQGQTDLLRLYDSVAVDQQAKVVKLTADIAPELMDKVLQLTDTTRGLRK